MQYLLIIGADLIFCFVTWLLVRLLIVKKSGNASHRKKAIAVVNAVVRCTFVWTLLAWLPEAMTGFEYQETVKRVLAAFIVALGADALSTIITFLQSLARVRTGEKAFSSKTFAQVIKLILWCGAIIVMVSVLMGKSPTFVLSGLGALTAILMLIFKDAILGLVAGIQVVQNDMVRLGDWITMPQYNADGNVIDIALTTVKVQNFDNTVTMIPSSALISSSFVNWRYMSDSKGRRIKRALWISVISIEELNDDLRAELVKRGLTRPEDRHVSNLAAFEDWIRRYLKAREDITQELTCMVRQLDAESEGIPIEIYCFTKTRDWEEYERIQTDLFDNLFVAAPKFGIEIFERTSAQRHNKQPLSRAV